MAEWKNVGRIQGEKGDKGDKGDRGIKGDKGDPALLNSGNGYMIFENGIQICWGSVVVERYSDSEMRGTWKFPKSFSVPPETVTFTLNSPSGDFSLAKSELTAPSSATINSPSEISLGIFRIPKEVSFVEGDKATVTCFAIGRS